jgi:hypothetical protein
MAGVLRMLKSNVDKLETIEAELASLNAQGAATCGEIEELEARENEIEDPEALAAAIVATKAARNRLRRIEAQIADARDRMAIAQDKVRAKLRAELLAAYTPAARDFLAKARAAQEASARLIAAREALQEAGFSSDYRSAPLPPVVGGAALLATDLLNRFEESLNPAPRLSIAPKPRESRPSQPAPTRLPNPAEGSFAVPAPVARRQVKRAPLREASAPGERLFAVARDGVEHARKGRLIAGDVISLTPEEAESLMRAGAGDWLADTDIAPAPDAEESAQ